MHIQAGEEFTHTLALTHAPTHTCTHALRFQSHALLRVLLGNGPPTLSFGVLSPRPVHCCLLRWACLTGVSLAIGAFSNSPISPRSNTSDLQSGTVSVPEDALHKASDVGVFGVMEGAKGMLLGVKKI